MNLNMLFSRQSNGNKMLLACYEKKSNTRHLITPKQIPNTQKIQSIREKNKTSPPIPMHKIHENKFSVKKMTFISDNRSEIHLPPSIECVTMSKNIWLPLFVKICFNIKYSDEEFFFIIQSEIRCNQQNGIKQFSACLFPKVLLVEIFLIWIFVLRASWSYNKHNNIYWRIFFWNKNMVVNCQEMWWLCVYHIFFTFAIYLYIVMII